MLARAHRAGAATRAAWPATGSPTLARILAITECFHAIDGARLRPRPPLSYADAIVELRRVSGTQLDARLVEIFIGIVVGSAIGILGASGGREAGSAGAAAGRDGPPRVQGAANAGRGSSSGC